MEHFDRLADIDCWIFDLDNTLYPPALGLFGQIDQRMGAFISALLGCDAIEARTIQKRYFHDHGTTLAGLMRDHDVCPETFLAFVHAVDLGAVVPDPELLSALSALPGRRHIFTNADADYAGAILKRRGIDHLFDVIVDIRACGYRPKPEIAAYQAMAMQIPGFDPGRSVFIDDMARNLRPAHAMGMATVWLDNGSEAGNRDHCPADVDIHVDDLGRWLNGMVASRSTAAAREEYEA